MPDLHCKIIFHRTRTTENIKFCVGIRSIFTFSQNVCLLKTFFLFFSISVQLTELSFRTMFETTRTIYKDDKLFDFSKKGRQKNNFFHFIENDL